MNFLDTLKKILEILSYNNNLNIGKEGLLSLVDGKIMTPVGDIYPVLKVQKSSLKNQFIDFKSLENLILLLTENNSILRVNHIGFCYKVNSQLEEKERVLKLIKNTKEHLYIEQSNDEGIWLFVGDNSDWSRMMLEFIPVQKTEDKWKDYWLPHIHIDIDTALTDKEIIDAVKSCFGEAFKPFPIKIDGIVYIVRNRLGVVDGININLDISAKSRDVKYQRQVLLKRIDKDFIGL